MERTFIEVDTFRRGWVRHGLDDDALRRLQLQLLRNPKMGEVVKGTGGLRKTRFADKRRGKGKSGSFRIIYLDFECLRLLFLILIYEKNEISDITQEQRNVLKRQITELKQKLRKER